jgi:heterodisulfide reductase subunit C
MQIVQQILFLILVLGATFLFILKVREIRRNINLGKDQEFKDNPSARWKNVLLLAFGQKKMFKRMTPAILHLFVYVGFVIINIEILEIILDGIFGTHRMFAPYIGGLYNILIGCFEILAALVLISCAIFLVRRNIVKLKRLNQGELNGWPKTDANAILITEIVLMTLLLTMNAADYNLQQMGAHHYFNTGGPYWVSGWIAPMFSGMSETSLMALERTCWWLHIVGIFAFLNYLPYSKHLHIVLAFPNAYYGKLVPQGKMTNMKDIQNEVLYMMEPDKAPTDAAEPQRFGAKDITDLSWKNLMDAYSCTECGRCTASCPANITGKKLSPRKIMMDTRDRMEEMGKNIDKNKTFVDDGKSLLHDYITTEELRACTTCNACVEACPVSIDPLSIILQLRRNLIMEESNAPQEWNGMFSNIENNMAPWKFSPDDRDKWVEEMV